MKENSTRKIKLRRDEIAVKDLASEMLAKYRPFQPFVGKEVKCEFCGATRPDFPDEGLVKGPWIFENHVENHLDPPEKITICNECHMLLHGLLRWKRRAEFWNGIPFIESFGSVIPSIAKASPPETDPWGSLDMEIIQQIKSGSLRVDPETGEVKRVERKTV